MSDEKKKEAQKSIYLQYDGKEISIDAVEKAVRENYDSIKKGRRSAGGHQGLPEAGRPQSLLCNQQRFCR